MYHTLLRILGSVAYVSLFEYVLHRWVMHKSFIVKYFRYPFERHALVHHRVYKADYTYHVQKEEDKETIPMAWWNAIVLLPILSIPAIIASLFLHDWWVLATTVVVGGAYYYAYERMHWCMHYPRQKKRLLERGLSGLVFKILNGHHLLHHRYMWRNFNVVLPLWDILFCTLIIRSKTRFAQAMGACVPNVQPLA